MSLVLMQKWGMQKDLLVAKESTEPAILNSTACCICDTILDIKSWAGGEAEEELAKSSSTPEIVKVDEASGSDNFKPFSLLMKEMTFWIVFLCSSDSGTWATMDGSTAPASHGEEARVGTISSDRQESEEEEPFFFYEWEHRTGTMCPFSSLHSLRKGKERQCKE